MCTVHHRNISNEERLYNYGTFDWLIDLKDGSWLSLQKTNESRFFMLSANQNIKLSNFYFNRILFELIANSIQFLAVLSRVYTEGRPGRPHPILQLMRPVSSLLATNGLPASYKIKKLNKVTQYFHWPSLWLKTNTSSESPSIHSSAYHVMSETNTKPFVTFVY